jgi:hypothetical protein
VRQNKNMSTVAEIEAVVPTLSVEELAALERLIHETRESKMREAEKQIESAYVVRTHSFGLKPGIDPTKLGQLAEEL